MTSASPAVEVQGLTKTYGNGPVVDDFDLRVKQGEFITLLGPSGSGKTSVLMMVAGFVPPSGGDIRLNGRSILDLPPHRRGMGVVFQNYALFPHRTVGENVAFPLRMRKVPKAEIKERVERAFDLVGLTGYGDRKPKELSGGQQQRVALARALVFEPPVLLMDEPLAALDRKLREQLQLEIKDIQRRIGVTVLFVTHDQSEALSMSHRIALMRAGRLVQVGTPSELYQAPADVFAAHFLGEANLIEARTDGAGEMVADGGLRLRAGSPPGGADRGVVVIRPERIRVNLAGDRLDNVVRGTVDDALYVGHATRVTVAVAGHRLLAYVSGVGGNGPPATGDEVTIGWNADDSVVVPASSDLPVAALSVRRREGSRALG
jgi:putative spermidine/putrescine transport system ATP-binding protein